MTINVTKDHISGGHRRMPRGCALSLALTDAFGTGYRIAVGNVYFRYPEYGAELDLPQVAIDFRRAFDAKEPVEPFSFEIDDPRD